MNQSEIYSLAKSAGLSDGNAKTAAAIAMAESGGNPNSHNATPPDDSYGLWQINMLGSLGPNRRFIYRLSSNAALYDPPTNARVMASISQGGHNFSPWTTYTRGTYKQFINNPVTTVSVAPAGGGYTDNSVPNALGAAKDAVSGITGLADLVVKTNAALLSGGKWISNPSNWLRIGYVAGGGALMIITLYALINSTTVGSKAITTGKKAAKTAATVAAV